MTSTLDQTEKSSSAVHKLPRKGQSQPDGLEFMEHLQLHSVLNSLPTTSSPFLPPGACLFLLFTSWENKGLQEPALSTLDEILLVHYDQPWLPQSLPAVLLASPQPQDMLDITCLPHPVNCSTKILSSMLGAAVQLLLCPPCSSPIFQLWLQ